MKIAIYANAHNEASNVDGWLDSCKGADYIVVADSSSSTDATVEKFRARGIEPYKINIMPFRSESAKNAVLALVPPDADICIPLDLDERLMPGWREALEAKWILGTHTNAFHIYVFDHKADGTPNYFFMQNRIHSRKGWIWRYPAHEGVYPYGDTQQVLAIIPEVRIEQWQDRTKNRGNVIVELKMGLDEYPDHTRMVFYYGRECFYLKRYKEAVEHLEHYLAMKPNFPLEQAEAAAALMQCYKALSEGKGEQS